MKTTDIPIYQRIADLYQVLELNRTLLYTGFDAFRREQPSNMRDAMPTYRQGFFSLALLDNEQGQTNVNDSRFNSFRSVLLVVNPEQVVSWSGRFGSGYILNFDTDFLGTLFNRNDFLFLQSNFGGTIDLGDTAPLFVALFEQLISNYAHPSADTPQIIGHYVMALLYKIRQHIQTSQAALGRLSQADRATVITEQFRALIGQLQQDRKTIKAYADELAVSPAYLSEAVKRSTGRSARDLLYEVQVRTARSLLRQTDLTIEQIALQLGFHSHAHFSHFFRTQTGQSPAQYRNS